MKFRILLITAAAAFFIGCSNPNGTYIVYSSEAYGYSFLGSGEREGFDYQASELLSQKMLGRRVNIEYNKDFIIFKDGGPEVVLQRIVDGRDTLYKSVKQEDGRKIQYELFMKPGRESNTIIATAEWTTNEVDTTGQTLYNVGKVARARCKIKKYDNK
ncbi:hypothetical protein [Pedobacter helvus]|uniref:Lipoprotein n=1 Tax=Pedobacter helvus TaxID=2563444 RepID=A0ABW9JD57_9SPHI|nr:hypothetical protein [Pedobacter ureilyticus]